MTLMVNLINKLRIKVVVRQPVPGGMGGLAMVLVGLGSNIYSFSNKNLNKLQ